MDCSIVLVLLLGWLTSNLITEGEKILAIFPTISGCHYRYQGLMMQQLLNRGHQILVISYFPDNHQPHPNYTSIVMKDDREWRNFGKEHLKPNGRFFNPIFKHIFKSDEGMNVCEKLISYDKQVYKFKPDMIIAEMYNYPCFISIAYKLDIPYIHVVSAAVSQSADYFIGNPVNPSYLSNMMESSSQNMNIIERLWNTLQYVRWYMDHVRVVERRLLNFDELHVRNKHVTMEKLYSKIALVMYNNHFSFVNRPNMANAIEVAGIHIVEDNPLPTSVRQFIEDAEHGVIYVSFGVIIKASLLAEETCQIFRQVFHQLPQRIIWCNDLANHTRIDGKVMEAKWLPQKSVLAHKNVKAFVSHGGLYSIYEAIHTATPMVGIPFWFDQYSNVKILEEKRVAIMVPHDGLNQENLLNAMREIIRNKSYRENMERYSAIFKERPLKPMDAAMFWLEYVMKHKGAPHMRIVSANMPIYSYFSLDLVLLFLCIPLAWHTYYPVMRYVVRTAIPSFSYRLYYILSRAYKILLRTYNSLLDTYEKIPFDRCVMRFQETSVYRYFVLLFDFAKRYKESRKQQKKLTVLRGSLSPEMEDSDGIPAPQAAGYIEEDDDYVN